MAESLAHLVNILTDEPSVAHRDRFFLAFSNSKVAIPVQYPPAGMPSGGSYTVGPNDRIPFPETQGPDGDRWLVVYCDAVAMQAKDPRYAWAELAGRVVLEVARADGLGIIVQNMIGEQPSWAGISKEDVVQILSGDAGRSSPQ
jgi:hypothetical protein